MYIDDSHLSLTFFGLFVYGCFSSNEPHWFLSSVCYLLCFFLSWSIICLEVYSISVFFLFPPSIYYLLSMVTIAYFSVYAKNRVFFFVDRVNYGIEIKHKNESFFSLVCNCGKDIHIQRKRDLSEFRKFRTVNPRNSKKM